MRANERRLQFEASAEHVFPFLPGKLMLLAIAVYALAFAPHALAQFPDVTKTEPNAPSDTQLTIFPHPPETRYWISGQANFIYQTQPAIRRRLLRP